MSELIAFLIGFAAMGALWFISDLIRDPYMQGYSEGLRDGIQEVLNDFPKLKEIMEGEQDETD